MNDVRKHINVGGKHDDLHIAIPDMIGCIHRISVQETNKKDCTISPNKTKTI